MNIVFCLPGKNFSGLFLQSWTQLLHALITKGINSMVSQHYDPVVYYVRNKCLGGDVKRGINQKIFNQDGMKGTTIDYVMWIDSDMIFKPDDFFKLLKNAEMGYSIISGLYLKNNDDYAAIEEWDEKHFMINGSFKFINKMDIINEKFSKQPSFPIIKVPYNGFGFMLIKKEVFDKIQYPWFEPKFIHMKTEDGTTITDFTSEDVSFCLKAAEIGYPTWVNTEVILGHEKSFILT